LLFTWIFGAYGGALAGVVGHELLHRKETVNKIVGTFGLTKFFYTHFFDEHLKGHHKTLGTVHDPATARKGQNIYSFII
jgi:alkane 1-monooxygenase